MLNIIVCLKQIIDPEIPPHVFQIDPVKKQQVQGVLKKVVSTYDSIAVEVGVQLKEKVEGVVTVISIADMDGLEALREAIAMGADEAVLLSDPAFDKVDSFGKAYILANAIRKLGDYDLILCGRQAGDVELGLVGPFLAEELNIPCVTLAATIDQAGDKLRVKRQIETGYEILEVGRPTLATVTNDETNVPRYPTVRGIRTAMRKEIPVWNADDLGVDRARLADSTVLIEMDELFIPVRKQRCEIITGDTGDEKAVNLVHRLRDLRLI